MKRLSILMLVFLAVVVVFSSLVAADRCTENNRIFRLSGTTNAHAAKYDFALYTTEICFSDYFNGALTSPHAGSGVVLKLSGDNNAHAEGPSGTRYTTEVKYGDLSCNLQSNSCSSGCMIASLSGQTNAHVGLPNAYPLKLCCSSSVACRGGGGGPRCGNGFKETGEQCENGDLGGENCASRGFAGGILSCYSAGTPNECTFNTESCTGGGGGGDLCTRIDNATSPLRYQLPDGNWTDVIKCDDYNQEHLSNSMNSAEKSEACNRCANSRGYGQPSANPHSESGDATMTNPGCRWDTSNNKCRFMYDANGKTCSEQPASDTTCGPDEVIKEITITTRCREATGGTTEVNSTVQMICPRPVKLPFFTWINFVSALIGIFLIYALYWRKKE